MVQIDGFHGREGGGFGAQAGGSEVDGDEAGGDGLCRFFAAEITFRSNQNYNVFRAGGQAPAPATSILAALRLSNAGSRTCLTGLTSALTGADWLVLHPDTLFFALAGANWPILHLWMH